ncbi:MATE family efflux transporter [Eubacteriales bacterium OttesenSCG-928-N13]|nr:MATE family efflux transporter [Eubacteriales bacterium OttesenSCG-928-N13]
MNKSILRWEGDFTKRVLRLAIPIAAQSLMLALMHVLDNVMIGNLGEIELAGVTQANRITFLMQVIMFGLISGSSILVSQYWGKKDLKGIHSLMGLGLITSFAIALAFAIPSLLIPEKLMRLLIQDEASVAAGVEYLRIIWVVYLMDALLMLNESVLKSTDNAMLPAICSVVGILMNTLFNWLLIFGRLGFPRMGVRGGALATLIAIGTQLICLLVASYVRKLPNAVKPNQLRLPARAVIVRYIKTVSPVLLNETLWSFGTVMYSAAYGRMGAGAVAAMSIFSSVEQLSFVTLRGMTNACSVLVGNAIGAKLEDDAYLIAKRMLLYTFFFAILTGVFVLLFAGNIVSLFNVQGDTAESARMIINEYAALMWLSAIVSTLVVGIMRAGGDVVYSGIIDVIFLWLVGVPAVWICGPGVQMSIFGLNINIAGLMLPIHLLYLVAKGEELLKLGFAFTRLKSRKWIHNLVEDV